MQELDLMQGLGLVGETRLVGLLSFETISRDATEREAGFDSDMVSGYGGVSLSLGGSAVLGLGAEISRWSGNLTGFPRNTLAGVVYDVSNGDFQEDAFAPVIYFSTEILDRGFLQVWTSYEFAGTDTSKEGSVRSGIVSGVEAQSSVDSRELSLGAQTIVDFDARGLVISPEAGLEFVRQWSDAFTETWDTVEVRFDEDDASSLQSALGVGVSTIVYWRGVAVQPYLALDWIHEYLDDARTINASIANTPIEFQTDEPDRDWFELSGEVSFALASGMNATVAAQIELDHRYYERVSVFGGISIPLN